jgi:hypothetical protein
MPDLPWSGNKECRLNTTVRLECKDLLFPNGRWFYLRGNAILANASPLHASRVPPPVLSAGRGRAGPGLAGCGWRSVVRLLGEGAQQAPPPWETFTTDERAAARTSRPLVLSPYMNMPSTK